MPTHERVSSADCPHELGHKRRRDKRVEMHVEAVEHPTEPGSNSRTPLFLADPRHLFGLPRRLSGGCIRRLQVCGIRFQLRKDGGNKDLEAREKCERKAEAAQNAAVATTPSFARSLPLLRDGAVEV